MAQGTMFQVREHADAASLLAVAESFLIQREVEHALVLVRARSAQPAMRLSLHQGRRVVGVAVQTPPLHLILSFVRDPLRDGALDALARHLSNHELPGVTGPAGVAEIFAERWAAGRARTPFVSMRLIEHALTAVVRPAEVSGLGRAATVEDLEVLVGWAHAFVDDTGLPTEEHHRAEREALEPRVRSGALHVWEVDHELVAMASLAGTARVRRVGFVYTPPAHRRRGYAAALVAALSQQALDAGCECVSLATDVQNLTTNRIYRAIGYRPIGETVMIGFR